MPILLIIADDLTGAVDTGVQFAKRGISTVVVPELDELRSDYDCDVLVVNTESRHANAAQAAEAVTRSVHFGQTCGVPYYYKKIDSTLRGNVGTELAALMLATGNARIMLIPAFPRMQRSTLEGHQYVRGIELHKSEFANDPLDPAQTSNIATLVNAHAELKTRNILRSQIASLQTPPEEGVHIFDAETDEDLQSIGDTLHRLGLLKITAGSAGFAECLGRLLPFSPGGPVGINLDAPVRMLVVNGSLNPAAHRQIREAADRLEFPLITLAPALLKSHSNKWTAVVNDIITRQGCADVLILATNDNNGQVSAPEVANDKPHVLEIAENLGSLVAQLLLHKDFQVLTVFGGDTLSAITRALKVKYISPVAELLPGVALSRVKHGLQDLLLISKAGGFGDDDLLPRVWESIRRIH